MVMSWFESKGLSTTLLVWHKTNACPLCNGKHISDVEFIVYVRGKGCCFNNDVSLKHKSKVFVSPICRVKDRLHPTQKRLDHLTQYIELHSREGDIIFDPFMGSGSTGVACINTSRSFIGIEKDDHYYEVACKRIEESERMKMLEPKLF